MFGGVAVGTTVAVAVPLGLAVPAASCCVHESCRMPEAPAVIVKLAAPIPSRVPLPAPTNDPPVTVHANGAPIRPMTVAGIVPPVVTNAAASDAVGALARAMMVTSVKPLAVAPAWFTSVSAMRSGDCGALPVNVIDVCVPPPERTPEAPPGLAMAPPAPTDHTYVIPVRAVAEAVYGMPSVAMVEAMTRGAAGTGTALTKAGPLVAELVTAVLLSITTKVRSAVAVAVAVLLPATMPLVTGAPLTVQA